jgi:hypothetical protein
MSDHDEEFDHLRTIAAHTRDFITAYDKAMSRHRHRAAEGTPFAPATVAFVESVRDLVAHVEELHERAPTVETAHH